MKWSNEDVKLVEKFITIKNKGLYADGRQVTEVYNRVLEKNLAPTSCGTCLRHRISELEGALNNFKKQMELSGLTSTQELVDEIKAVEDEVKPKKKTTKKK